MRSRLVDTRNPAISVDELKRIQRTADSVDRAGSPGLIRTTQGNFQRRIPIKWDYVWEIQSNDGSGVYTLRRQIYNWSAKTWGDWDTEDVTAHDVDGFAGASAGLFVTPSLIVDSTGELRYVVNLGKEFVSAITGIVVAAEGCYNITADSAKNPGGMGVEWRGRLLRIVISYAETDEASADALDEWDAYEVHRFRCGDAANGVTVALRANSILIGSFVAGGGTVYLFLNGTATGYFVVYSVGVTELQLHIRIDAGNLYDEDSNEEMDGGL